MKPQWLVIVAAMAFRPVAPAQAEEPKMNIEADGTVQVPAFTLPYSSLASSEAKAAFLKSAVQMAAPQGPPDIVAARKKVEEAAIPYIAKLKAAYPVTIEPKVIGGVYTEVFTPKEGITAKNKERVLIDLHGGGFVLAARVGGQMESIPIAGAGKIKVVSVDYRQGPENKFPAASQDVAKVYEELLKNYKPKNIGIYGCSAGGLLSAEAVAWFDREGLPLPGAIGVLCASLGPFSAGDSNYTAPVLTGNAPVEGKDGWGITGAYFGNSDPTNPLVYPLNSPTLLAKFPPTLFITGTRSFEMSGAVHSHIQLIKAGVDAQIFVWDGMAHGFFSSPDMPESKEVYDIIVDFFNKHLGKRRP